MYRAGLSCEIASTAVVSLEAALYCLLRESLVRLVIFPVKHAGIWRGSALPAYGVPLPVCVQLLPLTGLALC